MPVCRLCDSWHTFFLNPGLGQTANDRRMPHQPARNYQRAMMRPRKRPR